MGSQHDRVGILQNRWVVVVRLGLVEALLVPSIDICICIYAGKKTMYLYKHIYVVFCDLLLF